MGFGFQFGTKQPDLLEKLTSDQIDALIRNDNDEASGRRLFRWGMLGVGAAVFLCVCWLFLAFDQGTLLDRVLTHLMAFLGGTGIGWGIKSARTSS